LKPLLLLSLTRPDGQTQQRVAAAVIMHSRSSSGPRWVSHRIICLTLAVPGSCCRWMQMDPSSRSRETLAQAEPFNR
jgi:hypothetical protein